MGLVFKSLAALCKTSGLRFCPWKLVTLFCCPAVPPLQDGELGEDEEAELRQRRQEKMCIDLSLLLEEHGALKNSCSSLQPFTLHAPQKAQPPPTSGKQKGVAPGCQRPLGCLVHSADSQHPRPERLPFLGSSNFPLWADVSSSILEKKEPSVLFTF